MSLLSPKDLTEIYIHVKERESHGGLADYLSTVGERWNILIRIRSLCWSRGRLRVPQKVLCFRLWSGIIWGHQLIAIVLPCTDSSLSPDPLLSLLGERLY